MSIVSNINTQTLVTIDFVSEGRTVAVDAGTTILHAARSHGIHIDAPCNERGKCGKCRIQIVEGDAGELTEQERLLLQDTDIATGVRLACQVAVLSPLVVTVPEGSRNQTHRKAAADLRRTVTPDAFTRKVCVAIPPSSLERGDLRDDLTRLRDVLELDTVDLFAVRALPVAIAAGAGTVTAVLADNRLIAVEAGDTTVAHFGVALDIGTTTIVGYLVDLRTGAEVAVASHPNPQAAYGADVISRIEFAQGNPAQVETLRTRVTEAVNTILASTTQQAGVAAETVYELVMVGNTCMSHLFLGIDPEALGRAPYTPIITQSMCMPAVELGIAIHPRGVVRTLPNIAGFVGADTVGVLAASELDRLRGLHVAVDIGTNAEVMASIHGKVIACSTAAGPAFEGAKISQGMRAQPGAIEVVTISDDLQVETIGGKPATGICGSGIIDAIGELVRVGMLEASGRFADPDDLDALPAALRERMTDEGVVLVWGRESGTGGDIVLRQHDVREIQLVKAAIYAGIATLLDKIGHAPEDLDSLFIAGAFGTYITKEHAVGIGLIPDIPLERLVFLGNAAGIGAKMALISRREFADICTAARNVGYVELAGDEVFRDNFSMAMMLAPGCDA